MRKLSTLFLVAAIAVAGTWFAPKDADAIPSFARSQELACSSCHTQWPYLNSFGKNFYRQGFDTGEAMEANDAISLEVTPALSARLIARLFDIYSSDQDRTPSETARIRALHEAEIMWAGRSGLASYFFELEIEDETLGITDSTGGSGSTDNAFIPFVPGGFVALHFSEAINIKAGFGTMLGANGNETVDLHELFAHKFFGSDMLPPAAQYISLQGSSGPIWYAIGMHGPADDTEGHDAGSFTAHVSWDSPWGFALGGTFDSDTARQATDADTRFAISLGGLAMEEALQYSLVWGQLDSAASDDNDTGGHLMIGYVAKKGESPLWGADFQYDTWTEGDADADTGMTIQVHYFLRENVKAGFAYQAEMNNASGSDERNRTWIRLDMGI